jgi:hypothetical protein
MSTQTEQGAQGEQAPPNPNLELVAELGRLTDPGHPERPSPLWLAKVARQHVRLIDAGEEDGYTAASALAEAWRATRDQTMRTTFVQPPDPMDSALAEVAAGRMTPADAERIEGDPSLAPSTAPRRPTSPGDVAIAVQADPRRVPLLCRYAMEYSAWSLAHDPEATPSETSRALAAWWEQVTTALDAVENARRDRQAVRRYQP